jgi:hypothetical protein
MNLLIKQLSPASVCFKPSTEHTLLKQPQSMFLYFTLIQNTGRVTV